MDPVTIEQSNSFMKIMKIFGIVVGIHVFALVLIFANPGCSTATKPPPTPGDTVSRSSPPPTISVPNTSAEVYSSPPASAVAAGAPTGTLPLTPTTVTAPGTEPSSATVRFVPTRPGTPVAGALVAEKVVDVTPATTYVVKPGDNLWTIARKHKLTVGDLTAANGIAANTALQPGRKLVIPAKSAPIPAGTASAGGEAPAKAAQVTASTKAPGETIKHVVKTGETLGTIARNYGVRQADIAVANRISDPARIQAGTELIIPGWKPAAGKTAKSAQSAAAKSAPKADAAAPAAPATEAAPAAPAPPVVPIIRIDDSPVTPAPKP